MAWVNPYRAGQPVSDGPAFVGRQDVLDGVLRVLTRPGSHAASMVGQRRIGKTSVLHRLKEWLPTAGPFRPVFYDLSDGIDKPVGETLMRVARAVARELRIVAPARLDKDSFRDHFLPNAIGQLPSGTMLVLLLDEFDVLARAGEDGTQAASSQREFFLYLRELIERGPSGLGVLVAMGRNIADLDETARQIFKGIDTVRVGMLSQDQVAQLARLGEGLTWQADAVQAVWDLCGGQPYLTQRLCLEVWERASKPAVVDAPAVAAACDATLDAAEGALDWLWNGLSPANQIIAAALAGSGPQAMRWPDIDRVLTNSGIRSISELSASPEQLARWDLLRAEGDGWLFRSELLRRWSQKHHPLREVRGLLDKISGRADLNYRLAVAEEAAGQPERARELLDRALQSNPNHAGATMMIVDLLKREGDLEGAIKRLEGLYAARPEEARGALVEALLSAAAVDPDEQASLRRVTRALELSPGDPRATERLVALAQSLGAGMEGRGDLDEAGRIYDLAGLQEQKTKIVRRLAARAAAEKAEQARLRQLEARYQEARTAQALGDLARSEALFAEILASGTYRDTRERLRALLSPSDVAEDAGGSGTAAAASAGAPVFPSPTSVRPAGDVPHRTARVGPPARLLEETARERILRDVAAQPVRTMSFSDRMFGGDDPIAARFGRVSILLYIHALPLMLVFAALATPAGASPSFGLWVVRISVALGVACLGLIERRWFPKGFRDFAPLVTVGGVVFAIFAAFMWATGLH